MNTLLHAVRALLVSSSEAQTQRISALLTRARIVPFDHAGSARQALEQFDAGGIDGVLIAEPIAGSSGRELALQLKKRHCMAVLLLAAPEHADTDAALLEQSGVLDDGEMFLHRAGGIPERHIPTAEINQRGAEGLMRCV